MTIKRNRNEIIFRLPSSTKIEDLQELADLFEFKQIARKSKANQKEVDMLLSQSKKGRWEKIKSKLNL